MTEKRKIELRVDLQCGTCGALTHTADGEPRFCSCCGAGYGRYCMICHKKAPMFFEEYWPGEDECVRTYSPAKRCPTCNAGLEVESRGTQKNDSPYEH
ncbi:MAG: hypothetical protein AUJ52_15120 [Elusimicrobia bacterium CG1_02_63_36]|nr:MAG: hypothetical protein AUJ52_15120 [Elusimicrobia bacterium CG1_02_63_36]PIP84970.1 MAG: hypothetical protein COR54_01255 [Elusimicrobia bacterium CG22_combo_CG10-13_8_21_14_all_63_91]PJA12388.1 MAG: hypothetical protein COX66_17540 [Elusimicrobia bacterium CG_4_10_14_0_2_um_filter_63_34]PJB26167.1 MAG: hypothetical protein CO113_04960 [Elusimicrobia bacterium CG_4_9_14_3_um_filter_62_55]